MERGFSVIDSLATASDQAKACLFDLFHCGLMGDDVGFRRRLELFRGEAQIVPRPQISAALRKAPVGEQFVTFDDSSQLEEFRSLCEAPRWREWMTYLHPDQAHIVVGEYSGPARVRGVSGSGKTSVAVHRARFLARKYAPERGLVFLVTYNVSLTLLLESLVRDLCGAELYQLNVFTIQELARIMFHQMTGERHPDVLPDQKRLAVLDEVRQGTGSGAQAIARLDRARGRAFVFDELGFLRTRYSYADRRQYVADDLRWRSLTVSREEREDLCEVAAAYETRLGRLKMLDADGILLKAIELLEDRLQYAAVLPRCIVADEVQDFSQNELRLLASLVPLEHPDSLFLVGDGTQRVYKRGFSLARAGIDITGRAFVLTKSYRNSRQIMEASHNLVAQFTFPELDSEVKDKALQPDYPAKEDERPDLIKFDTALLEAAWIAQETGRLISVSSFRPGEIMILSGTARMREAIRLELQKAHIGVAELREDIGVDSERVKISTIESAKGHESPCVIVGGLIEGAVPWLPVDEDGERINASRLYVAMTRARAKLILTWSTSSLEGRPAQPSRFLRFIQPFCTEYRYRRGELLPA